MPLCAALMATNLFGGAENDGHENAGHEIARQKSSFKQRCAIASTQKFTSPFYPALILHTIPEMSDPRVKEIPFL